jgi:hypothetical protein
VVVLQLGIKLRFFHESTYNETWSRVEERDQVAANNNINQNGKDENRTQKLLIEITYT